MLYWSSLEFSLEIRLDSGDSLLERSQKVRQTRVLSRKHVSVLLENSLAVAWRVKIERTHRPNETRAAVTKWDRCGRPGFLWPIFQFPACNPPAVLSLWVVTL